MHTANPFAHQLAWIIMANCLVVWETQAAIQNEEFPAGNSDCPA